MTIALAGWNVLTVVGKAGCGKSVLGSFLAEQLYYFTSLLSMLPLRFTSKPVEEPLDVVDTKTQLCLGTLLLLLFKILIVHLNHLLTFVSKMLLQVFAA
jgi:ABC-type uncharacterized transport system YnjBCD ATPase subunit